MFNRYYQDELAFLREMGKEFASAYPQLAPLLSTAGVDPDVERLLEGVAFLTGRIRQKLDDELPELIQSLMGLLWPHYLRPIPAMSVVQFQPLSERIVGKAVIPRETTVQSREIQGMPCVFRTCYDVDLFPIALEQANIELPTASTGRLRLRFRLGPGAQAKQMGLSRLRLYLHAESAFAYELYLWLLRYVAAVRIEAAEDDDQKQNVTFTEPYPSVIKPVGFADDQALLPYPAHSFVGFRYLQEYFCFPKKFLFIDLERLEAISSLNVKSAFDVVFTFSRLPPDTLRVSAENIRLYCTPVINLFEMDADPLRIHHNLTEYRLRPGDPEHYEIFAMKKVLTRIQGTGEELEYPPFFSFKHDAAGGSQRTIYYQNRLREAVARHGTDTYISFVNLDGKGVPPETETVSARLVCMNRELPAQLTAGDICKHLGPFPEFAQFTNITHVTPPIAAPLGGDLAWRLVSHLTLNYLSLTRVEALRAILELYNFPALVDAQVAGQNRLRLEGIAKVGTEPTQLLYRGAPVPGIRMELTLDETNYMGDGDIYLFASVMNEFLSAYVTLNCTTQLVAQGLRRGEVYQWNPRIGKLIMA